MIQFHYFAKADQHDIVSRVAEDLVKEMQTKTNWLNVKTN